MKTLLVCLCALVLVPPGFSARADHAGDGFRLVYESWGTMLPVHERFTVDGNGNCAWVFRQRTDRHATSFKAVLSRDEFAALKKKLLEEYGFFAIPEPAEKSPGVKDSSTTFLTISWKGRSRRIGGYAAHHVADWQPVLRHVRVVIQSLKRRNGISR